MSSHPPRRRRRSVCLLLLPTLIAAFPPTTPATAFVTPIVPYPLRTDATVYHHHSADAGHGHSVPSSSSAAAASLLSASFPEQSTGRRLSTLLASTSTSTTDKETFQTSLSTLTTLNDATPSRTDLLNKMISTSTPVSSLPSSPPTSTSTTSTPTLLSPGLQRTNLPVAPGIWRVVYAPHMTTMAKVAGGTEDSFRVEYRMNGDGTMESHARLEFPWMKVGGWDAVWLSVAGTYGSVDETVCRVDFDEAWIKPVPSRTAADDDEPYPTLSAVPDSPSKTWITNLGRLFFVEGVSVFPVSFLDEDTIVFDFELLGTRICAKKVVSF